MTWGNIKKGDTVLRLVRANRAGQPPLRYKVEVHSVGPKWIVTSRGKYDANTGHGEYGQLHTQETLAVAEAAAVVAQRQQDLVDIIRPKISRQRSVHVLEAILKLCEDDTTT